MGQHPQPGGWADPQCTFLPEESLPPGSALTLGTQGRSPFSLQCLSKASLHRRAWATEATELLRHSPMGLHLHPRGGAVPQPSVHWSCQERTGLPGVLRQGYRPIGGTSSSQRQQDQLTPEKTRWQAQEYYNRNQDYMVLLEPDSPTTESQGYPQHKGKARFGFKSTSYNADRGH